MIVEDNNQSRGLNSHIFVVQALYAIEYKKDRSDQSIASCLGELEEISEYLPKIAADTAELCKNTKKMREDGGEVIGGSKKSKEYTRVFGTLRACEGIDIRIAGKLASNWRIDRLALVVLCILRSAIYDILLLAENRADAQGVVDLQVAHKSEKSEGVMVDEPKELSSTRREQEGGVKIGAMISEYLQVAKLFGHHKEVPFINGVLDKIAKDIICQASLPSPHFKPQQLVTTFSDTSSIIGE